VALRNCQPDLIVVPSATENLLGVERIGRCADARAVEIGCQVGVCHLVGMTHSDWVDENVGRLAFFSPSQSPFLEVDRHLHSRIHAHGFHLMSAEIDVARLRHAREMPLETNPSRVKADRIAVIEHPETPRLQAAGESEKQAPMKSLIQNYYAAFNSGDREDLLAMLDDAVIHEINEGPVETGKDAFRGFLKRMDHSYKETVEELVVFTTDDPNRAAAEFFIRGQYLVTDDGLPAACGQTYHLRVGAFFEAKDGRISRVTNHYNLHAWLGMVSDVEAG